jgi:hypothetical protein
MGADPVEMAPGRLIEKIFRCEKSGKDVRLSSPRCASPTDYCKWRTACPVRVLEREQARAGRNP